MFLDQLYTHENHTPVTGITNDPLEHHQDTLPQTGRDDNIH